MQLPVFDSELIVDVYVFDTMAVARTIKDQILFFMKPLSIGGFARRLIFNNQTDMIPAKDISAGVFEGNYTTGIVDFFAATNSSIYIYSFTLNPRNYTVTMTKAQHIDPTLDGT